ncbi:MAG: hypothetical protein ACOCXH_01085 [Cyclobacteriaceae bacterium]
MDDSITDIKQLVKMTHDQWKSNHDLVAAIKNLFNGQVSVRTPFDLSKMQESFKNAGQADNEVFLADDPTASMGIIYSLLYWFKYKKLPPEVGI